MTKKLLSAVLATAFVAVSAPAMAQNLAVVNGKAIPQARFDYFMEQFTKTGRERTPEMEKQVKEELIRREVYEQAALKQGMDKTPEFQQQMDLARQTILIRDLFMKEQAAHKIGEADIKAEYDRLVEANKGDEYKAAHILVETEAEAKAIIADLKKDAKKFAALAKEKSKDPGSAANGGDLGWSNPAMFVPEFGSALSSMKKGDISQTPVQTQFGWHILKLDDTRAMTPPKLEEVKPQIEQSLMERHMAEFQEKLYKEATIK